MNNSLVDNRALFTGDPKTNNWSIQKIEKWSEKRDEKEFAPVAPNETRTWSYEEHQRRVEALPATDDTGPLLSEEELEAMGI